jgi:hypothetical protein
VIPATKERSIEIARRARTEGVAAEGFSAAVDENERLVRALEEPALAAETAITEELRASR